MHSLYYYLLKYIKISFMGVNYFQIFGPNLEKGMPIGNGNCRIIGQICGIIYILLYF